MTIHMENRLQERELKGNLRSLNTTTQLIDFASNDYLGLARSEIIKKSIENRLKQYDTQIGSTGSRLLTGTSEYILELENSIAKFHGYEAGLIFGSGYLANIGLISAVAQKEDLILYDFDIHASIHDGMTLSKAHKQPFFHNNLNHLESRLKKCKKYGSVFICIESVYSTDGSLAPIDLISQLANRYGAHLIIDEAHAIGIYGPMGKGLTFATNHTSNVFAQIVTFGKALGSYGAIVLGSARLQEILINFARSFIYTTALPMPILTSIKCSYELIPTLDCQRQHLYKLINLFQTHLKTNSLTTIQPFYVHGNRQVYALAKKIQACGFDVRALTAPTVKQGKEMLRICLHSYNSLEETLKLISLLQTYPENV